MTTTSSTGLGGLAGLLSGVQKTVQGAVQLAQGTAASVVSTITGGTSVPTVLGLHPKVLWPSIAKALLGSVVTVITAYEAGGTAAIFAGCLTAGMTLLGLITGWAVPSPVAASIP
jgi:hypothetical protein